MIISLAFIGKIEYILESRPEFLATYPSREDGPIV